jgi:hypothetical protein
MRAYGQPGYGEYTVPGMGAYGQPGYGIYGIGADPTNGNGAGVETGVDWSARFKIGVPTAGLLGVGLGALVMWLAMR